MIKKTYSTRDCTKVTHLLHDYFPFTSLLRIVFNPFGMYHNYVVRQFLNRISTWNESSALQNYVPSVQPYYMVLNYKRQYIFNFSNPIFCEVMLTLVTLSPCSFLIIQVLHQQFHYFFLQFKIITTGLFLSHSLALLPVLIIYVIFFSFLMAMFSLSRLGK